MRVVEYITTGYQARSQQLQSPIMTNSSKNSLTGEAETQVERVESSTDTSLTKEDPSEFDFSSIDEKKLLRKLDWVLVPWLSFLYLLSFLDRTSIGNAKVS